MTSRTRVTLEITGWLALALPALYQITLLANAIAHRVAYPYDLEWMEGGMLHHALRIQQGQGIYNPPSIDFIPYLYTPLYPALLAMFGLLPMALSREIGSEVQRPLAVVVIGGLFSATALTLVVLPVLYQAIERGRGVRGMVPPDLATSTLSSAGDQA